MAQIIHPEEAKGGVKHLNASPPGGLQEPTHLDLLLKYATWRGGQECEAMTTPTMINSGELTIAATHSSSVKSRKGVSVYNHGLGLGVDL